MLERPKFIDSEYFVPEFGNWHLKPGAPKEIQEEFEEYKRQEKEAEESGVDL